MRQFTMNVDDGLLLAAKRHALARGTTLSDLVREFLAQETGWSAPQAPSRLDREAALPVLRAYSDGRIGRREAMDMLELPPDRHGDFVEAMNRWSVPWPTPDPEQIDREASLLVAAIDGLSDED